MEVTFKNVGQGDSIIIEWQKGKRHCVGVIDCKKYHRKNPVIEHLKALKEYTLCFVVFTHPHQDHCDGVVQLLNYLANNNIELKRLYHTFYLDPVYANNMPEFEYKLLKKFSVAQKLMDSKGLIKGGGMLGNDISSLKLDADKLILQSLSPVREELNYYVETVHKKKGISYSSASKAANVLSTILKIETQKEYCLFTADAEMRTFQRLYHHHMDELSTKKLHTCQIPHHGASVNFHDAFWRSINKNEGCNAVISVGENDYPHPSKEVLTKLASMDYSVNCTNIVNDAVSFYTDLDSKSKSLIFALDDDSAVINTSGKDLNFQMSII
jgi:beta-lactamase superfamily II metal-dependent hydrolase